MRTSAWKLAALLVLFALGIALASCGSDATDRPSAGSKASGGDFKAVEKAARGQAVRWWMYGGDPQTNAFVDNYVKPAAAKQGVRLVRVPVADTADAVNRVVAEERAGKSNGGGVDLIWINGENFAAGKKLGLWRSGWSDSLPNADLYDHDSSLIDRDFGVSVDGQESPWSKAGFVYAYDRARTPDPPHSFPGLLDYARAHPGRFAYPAPPDYTGSAFVRQVVQRLGSVDAAMKYLEKLKPLTYAEGKVQPKSEQELSQLYANDKVDFTMSYNSNFVDSGVQHGQLPKSSRPFLIGGGALQNTSYVTIPANASHPEGAEVVANLLLSPGLQARMQDPDVLGMLSVLDPAKLGEREARALKSSPSPYLPDSLGKPLVELPADQVKAIDRAWIRQVQR